MILSFRAAALAGLVAMTACGPADDVRLDPLPPLDRPTPESRAGLPEVAGEWRFTGIELPGADTAAAAAIAQRNATLTIGTQRLDSLAAVLTAPGVRLPLAGEARRDGTVALAGRGPVGESVVLAGRVAGDTLWVELVQPAGAVPWPADARAALVRGRLGRRFARATTGGLLYVQRPAPPPVDSARLADSLRVAGTTDSASARAAVVPVRPRPRPAEPVPVAPRPAPPPAADSVPVAREPLPPPAPRDSAAPPDTLG